MKKTTIFIALCIVTFVSMFMPLTNYSDNVKYDSNKVHHGKNSFKTKRSVSIIQWLSMRFKEGPTPSVAQKDIESILAEVELSQIDLKSASFADVPRATWIGHATVLVQYQGINFLTDPHLTDYADPFDFWAKRFTPPALTFAEMPEIDFVVISHNHYDHLDSRTVDMYGDSVTWLVPLGLKAWFLERGIATEKVIELDWWEPHQFSKKGSLTVKITFTPSVHWSKRTLWDTNKSLWGSWAVQI
jgi:N-acyl-phosphatidylethanolamine-hydrolysing phospholipase D